MVIVCVPGAYASSSAYISPAGKIQQPINIELGCILWHIIIFSLSARYEKCQTCYSHLVVLREDVEKAGKESGTGADVIRETSLLDCFAVLD